MTDDIQRASPEKDAGYCILKMHYVPTVHVFPHGATDPSGPAPPLPDKTQHSQETPIHAPGGIRTRHPSKPAAAEPRLRPRGHWDRLQPCTSGNNISKELANTSFSCNPSCLERDTMIESKWCSHAAQRTVPFIKSVLCDSHKIGFYTAVCSATCWFH
jgi:hypothetical protein